LNHRRSGDIAWFWAENSLNHNCSWRTVRFSTTLNFLCRVGGGGLGALPDTGELPAPVPLTGVENGVISVINTSLKSTIGSIANKSLTSWIPIASKAFVYGPLSIGDDTRVGSFSTSDSTCNSAVFGFVVLVVIMFTYEIDFLFLF
jgi:hypothetical protein